MELNRRLARTTFSKMSLAFPETLDGTGVLFDHKRFDQIAEMAERISPDETFRNAVEQQTPRLGSRLYLDIANKWQEQIEKLRDVCAP